MQLKIMVKLILTRLLALIRLQLSVADGLEPGN